MTAKTFSPLQTRDGLSLPVRQLCLADHKALVDFNAGLSQKTRRLFLPHAYDDATVDKALARSESGEDLLLGVFSGEKLVGYFFLWYFTRPVCLLGIGLTDEFQGRGLGRPMMQVLIDCAKEAGLEGIELTTNLDNARAFALYQSLGFDYYGDVQNLQGEGKWVVEKAMFLALKPGAKHMTEPHQPPV